MSAGELKDQACSLENIDEPWLVSALLGNGGQSLQRLERTAQLHLQLGHFHTQHIPITLIYPVCFHGSGEVSSPPTFRAMGY